MMYKSSWGYLNITGGNDICKKNGCSLKEANSRWNELTESQKAKYRFFQPMDNEMYKADLIVILRKLYCMSWGDRLFGMTTAERKQIWPVICCLM